MDQLNPALVPTPCYVCDEAAVKKNLEILKRVKENSGAEIILALKGFAMFSLFPLIRQYLSGTTASSVNEARLASEEFGGEVHVYAPAYSDSDFEHLLPLASHLSFNSISQWRRFKTRVAKRPKISAGIRINPEHSEVKAAVYDPCARYSRLGITAEQLKGEDLSGISGLHFHTLCELNADALERTLEKVESGFGKILKQVSWVNFGGGHHISRRDYDVQRLCRIITAFRNKYGVNVYLEPGEAVALNAGFLVSTVLDLSHNEKDFAIMDTSASAHMPYVLEMPYRPEILGAGTPGKFPHTYLLGGATCLAGDVIGEYSFSEPLKVGQKLLFLDMVHYTMVKNTTFNGIPLPSIAIFNSETENFRVVKRFGYGDYKGRLS